MWLASERAHQLTHEPVPRYRSAQQWGEEAQDEALELLSPSYTYKELLRAKTTHVSGARTWARLADGAVKGIADALLGVGTPRELEAVTERAAGLALRLRQRDALKSARVTKETRTAITQLASAAAALTELVKVIEGSIRPGLDEGGRAIALRQKWHQLGGTSMGWVRDLVERAVGTVLASEAHGGVKGLYRRALERWPERRSTTALATATTPPTSPLESPLSPRDWP